MGKEKILDCQGKLSRKKNHRSGNARKIVVGEEKNLGHWEIIGIFLKVQTVEKKILEV